MKYFTIFISLLGLLLGNIWSARAQTTPATTPPATGQKQPPPLVVQTKYAGKLSTDPAQYIVDMQTMMLSTNNAAARAMGTRLKELWGSNRLTSSQQARIVALSQTMLAKKFRPRPHFETFYGAIVGGAGTAKLTDQQMDNYLDVLGQTLEKEPTPETEKFMVMTNRFLNGGYLYKTGFNTLRAIGGTVSFAYSPIAAPESNLEFGTSEPAPVKAPAPAAPKPAPSKPAAKAPVKAAAKPAPKKKASSGWDTADMWSSPSGGGWGDDDGWGAPAKKKAPAKPAAKAPTKTAAAPSKAPAKAAPSAADFEQGASAAAEPSASPYDSYMAPPARGGVIEVKDADLFISTAGDSVFLRKVSGKAVPNTNRFVATSGQLTWSIKTNLVTADMKGFDFDMTKPEFTAEPVTLTYPALLEAPIKGALSYKSTRRKPGAADNGYPRFISLTNDARIKTLGENIRYQGGLSMAGGRLLSAALDGSVSNLTVSLDGKPKFKAASRAYVLGDSLITASRAAITIYQGAKDSLTHPGAQLKYLKGKQLLRLSRDEGLYKYTPYADSYHQMDIRTEMVTWDLHNPTIDFAIITSKNQQTADFESKEFFTNTRYQQLKSINKVHPLQMLVGYSQAHGNVKTMNVPDLAASVQTSEANMRSMMAGLARDGYAQWNSQTSEVTLLPKGTHYVTASRDKKDYDHLAIKSLTGSGRSATLNLNTNELLVRGVDRFNFNEDSLAVFAKPDSSIIRIQKNRNIIFSGTVVASAMRFRGKNFNFDYDGFYVDMAKIDSIVIRSPRKKAAAPGESAPADFALTNKGNASTGRLYINDPRNKSGRKKKPNFPSFDSKTGANVYFGKSDVLGGAYDSTLVFDIPPFKLDSLNGIGKSSGGFDGTFRSNGILPDIKTKLTSQPDGSLGFVYDVPKEGFPLYKGRGRVFSKVKLDSKGLQSEGTMTYLNGTFASDDFVYYRDSVVAVGKSGVIAAKSANGVEIPKITMPAGYMMKWAVPKDSMFMTTPASGESAKLYNDAYSFKGTALLTPKMAGGDGRLDGPQSFIKSPEFTFKPDSYSGKKATVSVKSAEANKPALTANDVAFNYDMKNGVADFQREVGSTASIDLPYSQFKTTLSGGHWDFKKKLVQLRVAPGADSTKSYFYSTNKEQHGLRFRASTGVYDLAKYRMEVGGVPYIASADAWIMPEGGKVSILAKGQLSPFKNAGVVMDSLAKFHNLYSGNIKVLSRDAFSGDALYAFKTARDSFAIKFSNFQTDSSAFAAGKKAKARRDDNPPTISTQAVANVDATTKLLLAPRVEFRGAIEMNSQRRGLIFDGQVQLHFGNLKNSAEWFAIRDSIDPKNVTLTLRDPKAADGKPLLTGLFMSDQTNKVYPLYVAALPNETDVSIFKVDGKLHYDAKRGEFTISRNDPTNPNAYAGALMTYKDSTGVLGFRGPLSFINSNKNYAMIGSGVGRANPDSARYSVDALLGIDIVMPPKAVDIMANELSRTLKNAAEAQDGSPNELYKLAEFVGDKGAESYANRRGNSESIMKLSPKLAHTLLLSKVNLKWSEKHKAWYSVGMLGLGGVGKQPMNAMVNGYVEIKRENAADVVEVYIEAEPQVWYYIKYFNNLVLTKGQNELYDAEIGGKAKGDYSTATSYGVFLGEYSEVDLFRSHFQRDYLGGSGKLAARPAAPVSTGNFDFAEDKKNKKKKGKADDAFGGSGDAATPPADAPPAEDTSKKKKKKGSDNDPFGGGGEEPAAATPAPTPTAPAATTPAVTPPAATTPATPAATPPATPTPTATPPAATTPAPTTPAPTTPAADPATAPPTDPGPDPALVKKEAEKAAKEAEKAAKAAAKEAEKAAKEEEKKKKAAETDPFGG